MFQIIVRTFAVIALMLVTTSATLAGKRVALVIGNSNYVKSARLMNPANDASRLAAKLTSIGFDKVTMKLDLAQAELRRTLGQFSRDAAGADIALIYFAGHGIEVDGTNYVIPTDAKLSHVDDVEFEAIELSKLMSSLNRAGALKLVILDACRNNPFKHNMSGTGSTRAIGRGLARVSPSGGDTLVAYAAREGTVASDGDGEHSPYADALIKHIATPGIDVRLLFGRVRDDVLKSTGRRQEPFTYGSLGGNAIYLEPPRSAAAPANDQSTPAVAPSQDTSAELIFWNSIKDTDDTAMLADYVSRFPAGTFSGLAKIKLKALKARLALATLPKDMAADAYKPVPVDLINPVEVPDSLKKLLITLALAADRQDLATVRSHVGKKFFWDSDHGGGFEASLPPSQNFANALSLDPKNIKAEYKNSVWADFKLLLRPDTASRYKRGSSIVCLPGKGQLRNEKVAEITAQKFGTDPWYGMKFSLGTPTVVRSSPKRDADIVGTVIDEAVFVRHELRTDPDVEWEPLHLANGVKGWARKDRVRTFLGNQLCFSKDKNERWKIVGYNAGGD